MGVRIPLGFGLAAARIALSGKADRFVITTGIKCADDPAVAAQQVYQSLVGVGTNWGPLNAGNMCVGYTLEGVTVTKGPDSNAQLGVYNQITTGTNTAAALPPNCAVLVRKNTALQGRRFRGRLYCPPLAMAEGVTDTVGNIAPTTLASIQTGWNFFVSLMDVTHDRGPFLLHADTLNDDGDVIFAAPPPTKIVSMSVQGLIATQRRRLR